MVVEAGAAAVVRAVIRTHWRQLPDVRGGGEMAMMVTMFVIMLVMMIAFVMMMTTTSMGRTVLTC